MITPAMQELIGLSVEMGFGNRTVEEARRHIADKQEMIHEAIHDALARARDDFDMAMTLVDTSKSLVTRDILFRRRAGLTPEETSGTVVMAMTRPQFADQYLESSPETALCNLYLGPEGDLWALIVQNLGDGRPLGKTVLGITDAGSGHEFVTKLNAYASRKPGTPPDFQLQAELLRVLGTALIPFFVKMKVPRKLVLIPHRGLHLLPLHAMFAEVPGERLYLDGFVAEIVYASCLTELLYANVQIPRGEPEKTLTEPRMLAALDTEARGLSWIEVERSHFEMFRKLGYRVDVVTSYGEIPIDLSPYVLMNWSGHATSDPYSWGQSRLSFGGREITASTIASNWDFGARPVVTLAACEGATNQPMAELVDEYCGLDRALRIAGAREVLAALWPIVDPLGALASIILPLWIVQHGVSAAHALVIFQSNLRRGIWKQWFLTDEQLKNVEDVNREAAQGLREIRSEFHKIDQGAFMHAEHWSAFRCYGG